VTFGAKASLSGSPSWDGTRCSNVYCHGTTSPRWDDPTPPGGCDRCHGNPPASHARNDCATCHPADAPHIDGIVQVGRTPGCSGCHGSATSPAPPSDLSGNTFTTAIGVGAHQAHLQSQISAPIACATCHLVPSAIDSPGHIDTPSPAEVVAIVGWDRTTQTCTASCHGPARPAWTSSGQVTCGSCHGLPPADASHSPTMTIASCTSCHPDVDSFGSFTNVSAHADGNVDLR
jgi:predicted CxxxxCH...CXXCH cytochrome family protein